MKGEFPLSLAEPAAAATARIRDADYARLVTPARPDGLAAAVLLAFALEREGIDFHLTVMDDLAPVPVERMRGDDLVVLIDGWADVREWQEPELRNLASRAIVITHDAWEGRRGSGTIEAGTTLLEPSLGGHDGAVDTCASSLAYLVASALDRRNVDLAFLAFVGAVSERQTWTGLHASLLAEAEAGGAVRAEAPLIAPTVGDLLQGPDPFVRGVAGRARAAQRLARDWGWEPDRAVASLSAEDRSRLLSRLTLALLEQGVPPSTIDLLLERDIIATAGPFSGRSALDVARALTSACEQGHASAALAAMLARQEIPTAATETMPALIRAEQRMQPKSNGASRAHVQEAPPGGATRVADIVSSYLAGRGAAIVWERVLTSVAAPQPPLPLGAPHATPVPGAAHRPTSASQGPAIPLKGPACASVVVRTCPESGIDAAASLRRAAHDERFRGTVVAGHRLGARACVEATLVESFIEQVVRTWN
ncbi:MAG: hypothetical protein ACYDDF_03905 [Thermoplasmatota archaeon]